MEYLANKRLAILTFMIVLLSVPCCIAQKVKSISSKAQQALEKADSLSAESVRLSDINVMEFEDAVILETEALKIREKILGKNHPDYVTSLINLAEYNFFSKNYKEWIKLATQALDIREKLLGKVHPDYAMLLSRLAQFNSYIENYKEAAEFESMALDSWEKILGKDHPEYVASLCKLANYHYGYKNYKKAIELENEALGIKKKIWGKDHPDYALSLRFMENCNVELGNYEKAIEIIIERLNLYEPGKENERYVNLLNSLLSYYLHLGKYEEAKEFVTEILNVIDKESVDYAWFLRALSDYSFEFGKYEEAIELERKALNVFGKVEGKNHSYKTSLGNLAFYNEQLGNYKEAIKLESQILSINEEKYGEYYPHNAQVLSNLALRHGYLGNYKEAIELEYKALDIYEKMWGKDFSNYVQSLMYMAVLHYALNDTESFTKYSVKATRSCCDMICKRFAGLTAYSRNLLWQEYQSWFSEIVPDFAYRFLSDSLIMNAYNATLFGKGLLLNSEMEMNKILLESRNEKNIKAYQELQQTRHILNKLYEQPIAERQLDTDSLERVTEQMERELIWWSKAYGDYTRNLTITWEDIQRRLGERDVAIEFVSFPHGEGSTIYAAYVLNAEMSGPQMVPLFEAKQLTTIPRSQYYTTPEVGQLVWGRLDGYLKGCDNVYFAPVGELYNIAIESLTDYDGDGLISDRYNFYRLSSTRELAVAKDKNEIKEAVLYGGLHYDTDTRQMEADSRKYLAVERRDYGMVVSVDSLPLRGGVKYLPATKTEAEHIDGSLRRAAVRSTLFTDSIGTEASFKNLSGKKKNILHIATHGFYWSEREARMKDHLSFLMQGDSRSPRYVEDKAMTRSGLLFSGANNALQGNVLPENVEDGILTAKEIASLDLRGLDLVVLSACQTGLGEITGDGVFGLQRGFKKAGANTILMSLWSVPDAPTQLLMERFYENLLINKNPKTGKQFTKFEALKSAQQHVKNYKEKGTNRKPYANPENWAGFILLDAIE